MDDIERLILCHQLRILEHVDPEQGESYRKERLALAGGYSKHYESENFGIFEWFATGDQVMSEEECDEIWDTLTMYEFLQRGYDELEDQTGIEERDILFPGYDGNHEAKVLNYARYIIEEMGRYSHLNVREGELNSHGYGPGRVGYQRMIETWEACDDPRNLSKDDIQNILDAH